MVLEVANLPDSVPELKDMFVSLAALHQEKEQEYQSQIHLLHEQIRHLRSKLFGRKAEKYVEGGHEQVALFDEVEQVASSDEDNASEEVAIAAHKRKKRGRKPLPEALPRVEIVHDLAENDKVFIHISAGKDLLV